MVNLGKNGEIVHSKRPIALFGGGEIGPDDLNLALNRVNGAVAADGGAAALIDSGRVPDAVIGDFDSLERAYLARIPEDRLFPIREQDSTDFEKCLYGTKADLYLGVGFMGRRLDHSLACLRTLAAYPDKRVVLVGEVDLVFLCPRRFSIDLAAGTRVSIFPMGRVTVGPSNGLRWPLDGLVMEPFGQIGTSNVATGETIRMEFDADYALVILPVEQLETVTKALFAGP